MISFCPVCGYELPFAPWSETSPSDEICPSCGTHFGYDDFIVTSGDTAGIERCYSALRASWINGGLHWWSTNPFRPKPDLWDPVEQLKNIKIHL